MLHLASSTRCKLPTPLPVSQASKKACATLVIDVVVRVKNGLL
jgi:hypothetical protein